MAFREFGSNLRGGHDTFAAEGARAVVGCGD